MTGDIEQHLEAPLAVGRGEEGVEHRFLLGRVGIELRTHRLHALDDLRGRAQVRALEEHVLYAVRQAMLEAGLVAAADGDTYPEVAHGAILGGEDDT